MLLSVAAFCCPEIDAATQDEKGGFPNAQRFGVISWPEG